MSDPRQPPLFDLGPAGVSARMQERRSAIAAIVALPHVRLLGQVALRLGRSYSTFLRWRRRDPGLEAILGPVRERRRRDRSI